MIGEVMTSHGLQLASLKTGRARHVDKVDFQSTFARYRGQELFQDGGKPVHIDLVYRSKHMGRGVDKIFLGVYRMICANGLMAGSTFFSADIRHAGNTYDNLNRAIESALNFKDKLMVSLDSMRNKILTDAEREALALEAVKLLTPQDRNVTQVRHALLQPRRAQDTGKDLWTTYNVIQENGTLGKVAYQLQSYPTPNGPLVTRNMTVRPIRPDTSKDSDFNQALFDAAAKLAA
jgi:hypothetical protein